MLWRVPSVLGRDTISLVENMQYCRRYSVLWENTISAVMEYHQCCGGYHQYWGGTLSFLLRICSTVEDVQ